MHRRPIRNLLTQEAARSTRRTPPCSNRFADRPQPPMGCKDDASCAQERPSHATHAAMPMAPTHHNAWLKNCRHLVSSGSCDALGLGISLSNLRTAPQETLLYKLRRSTHHRRRLANIRETEVCGGPLALARLWKRCQQQAHLAQGRALQEQ